jgi:hypothetical protein
VCLISGSQPACHCTLDLFDYLKKIVAHLKTSHCTLMCHSTQFENHCSRSPRFNTHLLGSLDKKSKIKLNFLIKFRQFENSLIPDVLIYAFSVPIFIILLLPTFDNDISNKWKPFVCSFLAIMSQTISGTTF